MIACPDFKELIRKWLTNRFNVFEINIYLSKFFESYKKPFCLRTRYVTFSFKNLNPELARIECGILIREGIKYFFQ